jgi:hypothetical protein
MRVNKKEVLLELLLQNLTDEETKNLQTRCIELIQDADWFAFNFKDIIADQVFYKVEGWNSVTVKDLENRLGIIKPKYRYTYKVAFLLNGFMYSQIEVQANNKEQVEHSDEYLYQKMKYQNTGCSYDTLTERIKNKGDMREWK